jgi:hypothetical protein
VSDPTKRRRPVNTMDWTVADVADRLQELQSKVTIGDLCGEIGDAVTTADLEVLRLTAAKVAKRRLWWELDQAIRGEGSK